MDGFDYKVGAEMKITNHAIRRGLERLDKLDDYSPEQMRHMSIKLKNSISFMRGNKLFKDTIYLGMITNDNKNLFKEDMKNFRARILFNGENHVVLTIIKIK